MRNKVKYVIMFLVFLVMGIISINLYQPNKQQQVRGSLELLVNENTYDYLVECANNFMKENDKTSISVKKLDDYDQIISNKSEENSKIKITSIAQIDRFNFDKLKLDNYKYYNQNDKILDDYAKNFSKHRIEEVKYGDNSIGIPLTSRPLALYVREDMLKTYGYERDDINTWDDFIRIGKDIYAKSNETVKILNATGQDYEDILDLLTMESLGSEKSVDQIKLEVQNMINNLENNNILNLDAEGKFLARISSINGMRELASLDETCQWSIGNVPSIKAGANKFFASEGDNLVVLNQDSDNEKLAEKFLAYIITDNNDETIKYVKAGEFFSSYLNTYSSNNIDEQVKNFVGKSPLVILSNIDEKAPELSDYDKYIKIKQELRGK